MCWLRCMSTVLFLTLCLLACFPSSFSLVNFKINITQPSFTPINRDLYHSRLDLMEEIKTLVHRHPGKLTLETIKGGNKGYRAESFGQHGRELITTELALRVLSILSEEQFLLNTDRTSLNSTLDNLIIKDYDPYEENPGTGPFSEPETQIMRKLAISFEPHIWVNVHSGMEALFMPYDHKSTTPDGAPLRQIKLLIEELNHLHCHERCMVGSGGGSVGYLAHGTATDYMYDIIRVPMAFTFEIYGDGTASTKDCFRMFNPIDTNTFNRVMNDWCGAFFTIFKLGTRQLGEIHTPKLDKLVSIDEYLEGYLLNRSSRYGKKKEVIDLGFQEIRAYFRLFLLSTVLLMFMFCSRISKSK